MKKNACAVLVFVSVIFGPLGVSSAAQGKRLSADEAIKIMGLEPMPGRCGGYYKEIFRSSRDAKLESPDPRKCGSIIYHLIKGKYVVPFHKITSDEIFSYLAGDRQVMLLVYPDGKWEEITLGNNLAKGETPVKVVPAGVWMAELIKDSKTDSWSLITVTVMPGFDPKDYSHSSAADIIKNFPETEKRIKELGLDKE
ncbi:MAG: cupin domain-containing protein [Elusimicrobiaceae bacterium]